jgi:hypothetical protein
MPSRGAAAELAHFERSLDAEIVFAIEVFGDRLVILGGGASASPGHP